ncbi:MAG TPA: hypothetical protein PK264_10705 [Hyphomicrobiaceae bacterium]|nr:hypothetical protein [Hyphomicrobiaceae bacterium]
MRLVDITLKVLGISEAIRKWQSVARDLDGNRRDRIARYAEEIAGTIARIADAMGRLAELPGDRASLMVITRELGRLSGYIETIVACLEGRIDGRGLNGVKRRLESLREGAVMGTAAQPVDAGQIDRLVAAEGYFRALADSLRT